MIKVYLKLLLVVSVIYFMFVGEIFKIYIIMNYNQYKTLEKIATAIAEHSSIKPHFEAQEIRENWKTAVYLQRLQRNLESDEVVKTLDLFCETENKLKYYNIRANRNLTRIKYFQLLCCNDAFLTYEKTKSITQI